MKLHLQKFRYILSVSLLITLLSVGIVLAQVAPDVGVSPEKCYKIMGATTTATPQLNAGQIDFNFTSSDGFAPDPDQIPAPRYQGCVFSQTSVSDKYVLGGWAWNTNLGWVSMGSFGTAAPYRNRGIDTGAHRYVSYAEVTRDASNSITGGVLEGYWWGDNLGWVRLHCRSFDETGAGDFYDGDTSQCGSSNYGVSFGARDAGTGLYHLSGYAWSDNLGWINMSGIRLDLDAANFAVTPRVTLIPSVAMPEQMYANGSTNYNIMVELVDGAGTNVTQQVYDTDPTYTFCLLFSDNRKINTVAGTTVNRPMPSSCGGHATTSTYGANLNLDFNRANLPASEFYFDSTNDRFLLRSSSLVKSYLSAVDGELVLRKIRQTVGREWDVNLSLNFVDPFKFELLPKEISSVSACTLGDASLNLNFGSSSPLSYCGYFYKEGGVITNLNVDVQLPRIDREGLSLALYQRGADGLEEAVNPFDVSASSLVNNFYLRPELAEDAPSVDPDTLKDLVAAQGINSTVTYSVPEGSAQVVRPGPALQQVDLRIDQVAIKGSVEDRAFTQIKEDAGSSSSGGRGGTKSREKLLKNIFDLTGGKGKFACTAGTSDLPSLPSYGSISSPSPLTQPGNEVTTPGATLNPTSNPFAPGNSVSPKPTSSVATNVNSLSGMNTRCRVTSNEEVYYIGFTQKERSLVNMSDLSRFFATAPEGKQRVLILVGADLVVDQDYSSSDNVPAIVLLQNTWRLGGNVYLTATVNDFRGYLFADKTVFSVEDASYAVDADPNTGEPDRDGQDNRKMYSEFAFVGQFWSKNCVGCSLLPTPLKGDGTVASSREVAQNYDINFWRFSPLRYRFETVGTRKYYLDCATGTTRVGPYYDSTSGSAAFNQLRPDLICWADSIGGVVVQKSAYITAKQGAERGDGNRSVNIIFEPAPKTMPIFGDL